MKRLLRTILAITGLLVTAGFVSIALHYLFQKGLDNKLIFWVAWACAMFLSVKCWRYAVRHEI